MNHTKKEPNVSKVSFSQYPRQENRSIYMYLDIAPLSSVAVLNKRHTTYVSARPVTCVGTVLPPSSPRRRVVSWLYVTAARGLAVTAGWRASTGLV